MDLDIEFHARLDRVDLIKALQDDYPDLSLDQIMTVIKTVQSKIDTIVDDAIWAEANRL